MERHSFFLTFDGGPNPPGTDNVLRTLDRHAVTATFFLEGWRLEDGAGCAQRIVDAGHEIGNHSYSHSNLDELPPEECLNEVRDAAAIIHATIGVYTRLFRPPWGRLDQATTDAILDAGHDIALWNCSVRDWEGPDADAVATRLLASAHDEGIVALHDRVTWNPAVLDRVIPVMRDSGYEFRPMSEAPDSPAMVRAGTSTDQTAETG